MSFGHVVLDRLDEFFVAVRLDHGVASCLKADELLSLHGGLAGCDTDDEVD